LKKPNRKSLGSLLFLQNSELSFFANFTAICYNRDVFIMLFSDF
jgi:hypothetical protein